MSLFKLRRNKNSTHPGMYPSRQDLSGTRQAHLSWLPVYEGTPPPPHAVEAEPGMYVIRRRHEEDVIPGKWPYRFEKGYISYGGEEIQVDSFEVLCNTSLSAARKLYNWIPSSDGQVPHGALQAGMTANGEPLFVARGRVEEEMCIGKVHPSHQCAYVPWGGSEHRLDRYEVLCFLD
ncbi:unnamed protein product [Calicophoron daubneyi]|uniref:DM9 domain-containing protein n=1 Tax=Calicophoron daubneyi TaxID=300641 RepID=A0AAV2T6H3_CALDB